MAATTPPPPNRARTPPTPLHGPHFDGYEPYSPRRSSRVAAQPKINYSTRQINLTPSASRNIDSPTSSTPLKSHKARPNHRETQNISPPSSPSSPPFPQSSSKKRKIGGQQQIAGSRLDARGYSALDSDSELNGSSANRLSAALLDPRSMLPTPAKTPRKRPPQSQSALNSTARVLFQNRPAKVDDAMPKPKKGRGSRRNGGFSLQSFAEDVEDGSSASKIEIYTDSKERVPSVDADDDNPFMSKNKGKGLPGKSSDSQPPKRRVDKKTAQMEAAAKNDEGIIYVFRGKKYFRKYEDEGQNSGSDNDLDDLSDLEIRRKAGVAAKPRLLRSNVKPRLLFPPKEARHDGNAMIDEEDEEATTDLEEPMSPPAHEEHQSDEELRNTATPKPSTPFRQRFQAATPPSTRPTRNSRRDPADARIEEGSPSDMYGLTSVPQHVISPPRQNRQKKSSPFDSWQRVKQSSGSSSRVHKREAEPTGEEPTIKRPRGSAHASSSAA